VTGRLVRYAVAAALARTADEMVGVSVVLLVLGRTGSAALAGAAVAGYTLPAVVSGPLLGAWLTSAGRRAPLALALNEIVLAAVAIGLALGVGHMPGWCVVLLTFFAGLSLPLTSAGFSSLLPGMVGRAALPKANTLDATTVNGPAIGGPAIAGSLAATLGPGSAALAIAGVSLVSAVATCFLRIGDVERKQRPSLLRVARAGLTHLARTPPLRAATLASAVSYGSFGLLVVAIPVRMARLGVGESAAGYLWTTLECGSVLSILLISPRLHRIRPELVVSGAVAGFGAGLALLAVAPNLAATLIVAAVAGFAEGPNLPAVFAARQRYSPDDLLAQVSTTGVSLKIGGYALGSVLSGTLTGVLGATGMILLAAAGQFAAAIIGALWIGRVSGHTADP
jgi:MFS family permease